MTVIACLNGKNCYFSNPKPVRTITGYEAVLFFVMITTQSDVEAFA